MASLTVEYFKKNYESLKDIPDDDLANVLHRLKEDWITTTTSLESVSRDGLIQKNYPLMFINALKPEEVGLSDVQHMEEIIEHIKQVSLNLCLWCFICCVRHLSISPLFSLWV
jgi:hypothetical protein